MPDFNLFRHEVLSLYKKNKESGELDSKFDDPSPANLREYCLVVLSKGLAEEDKRIMQEFFNPRNTYATLAEAINKNTDRLRPLQNLIDGTTTKPNNDLLVKLLAILVDYKPRPFVLGKWSPRDEREKEVAEDETVLIHENPEEFTRTTESKVDRNLGEFYKKEDTAGEPKREQSRMDEGPMKGVSKKTSPPDQDNSKPVEMRPINEPKSRKKWLYLSSATAGIVMLFIGWIYMQSKQCMCWEGHSYKEIDCQDATYPLGQQKIALDPIRLRDFERITSPDTLTEKHENKVWYSKIDHDVEFFTTIGNGYHPEYPDRSLKAATKHILNKYAGDSARVYYSVNEKQSEPAQ